MNYIYLVNLFFLFQIFLCFLERYVFEIFIFILHKFLKYFFLMKFMLFHVAFIQKTLKQIQESKFSSSHPLRLKSEVENYTETRQISNKFLGSSLFPFKNFDVKKLFSFFVLLLSNIFFAAKFISSLSLLKIYRNHYYN